MNNILKILCFIVCFMFLTGCWVAMPSKEPIEAQKNVGKVVVLQKDILIVSYFITPVSWEVENASTIGANQKILKTLKKGTVLKIKSVKSFLDSYATSYAYRCADVKSGFTFDLMLDMKESVGL